MRRSGTTRKAWLTTVLGAAGIAVILVAWQLASALGVLDETSFPPPSKVLPEVADQLGSSAFWSAAWQTFESTALGLGISVVIGVPLGIAIGLSERTYLSTRFLVEMLKPIPPIALLPLGLIIYGTTLKMKLLLIVFGTLWTLLMQTVDGVRDADPTQLDTAQSYRLGRRRTIVNVVLPTAGPYLATGVRLAAVAAFLLSIVTELVGSAPGIGLSMQSAQNGANYEALYALIIITGLIGLGINGLFALAERPLLFWHPSQRRESLQ